mgnify:FL=1
MLQQTDGLRFQFIRHGETNYSYFPVIFETEEKLNKVEKALNAENVFPRRYFYPSVNTFNKVVQYQACPVSESISKRVLCLPLYFSLPENDIHRICEIIKNCN